MGMSKGLLLPVFCVLALLALIESTVQLVRKPSFWDRSTWLTFDPYKGESFDRLLVYQKLSKLVDEDPDIISVGDSSGFFSLQANIVNRHIAPLKYVNLSTGANHAFDGYAGIAEYMLQRCKHIKYVVLYMYPQLVPEDAIVAQGDLGTILQEDIVGAKAYLTPPSAALSPYAKYAAFYGTAYHPSDPLSGHEPSIELADSVRLNLGWLHEYDMRFDRLNGVVAFSSDRREHWYDRLLGDPSGIHERLTRFNDMVRKHGAQLVIAFAPLPDTALRNPSPEIGGIQASLAAFQGEHPEIKFLFPLLTPYGAEKFGAFNHVTFEYSFISSARLGKALARFTSDPASIPPFKAMPVTPRRKEPATVKPLGPADPKLLDAAMAFYLYGATGDDTYRALITRRVLGMIDADPNFGFARRDTHARLAMFNGKGVKIGYDTAQLIAEPVDVTGFPFCDPQPDTRWALVSGTMLFTYNSQTVASSSPVAWPKNAWILIPTRIEDEVLKFDGYCPEPSQ